MEKNEMNEKKCIVTIITDYIEIRYCRKIIVNGYCLLI